MLASPPASAGLTAAKCGETSCTLCGRIRNHTRRRGASSPLEASLSSQSSGATRGSCEGPARKLCHGRKNSNARACLRALHPLRALRCELYSAPARLPGTRPRRLSCSLYPFAGMSRAREPSYSRREDLQAVHSLWLDGVEQTALPCAAKEKWVRLLLAASLPRCLGRCCVRCVRPRCAAAACMRFPCPDRPETAVGSPTRPTRPTGPTTGIRPTTGVHAHIA